MSSYACFRLAMLSTLPGYWLIRRHLKAQDIATVNGTTKINPPVTIAVCNAVDSMMKTPEWPSARPEMVAARLASLYDQLGVEPSHEKSPP